MTTEEQTREFLRDGNLLMKSKTQWIIKFDNGRQTDLVELFAKFHNSQQPNLTLDSKIKDGKIVEEPKLYDEYVKGDRGALLRQLEIEEYQSLPTLRDCLKEFEELREDVKDLTLIVKRGNELLDHQEEQIEKLTKDKTAYEIHVASIEKQLQAEKQKNEELIKFIMNKNLFEEYCKWLHNELLNQ